MHGVLWEYESGEANYKKIDNHSGSTGVIIKSYFSLFSECRHMLAHTAHRTSSVNLNHASLLFSHRQINRKDRVKTKQTDLKLKKVNIRF